MNTLDVVVDDYIVDDICGCWEICNMFCFNGVEFYFHREDFGKIFSIPYRGSYIELKEGKMEIEFYDNYLVGKVLHM